MFWRIFIYLVVFFFNFTSMALAMDWLNERIPRKELVTPVVSFKVDLLENSQQTENIKFKYPGQYSVNLIMYGTKANQPPRADSLATRDFSLQGLVEIENSRGVFYRSPFDIIFGSNKTGAYLMSFELDRQHVDEESVFRIRFDSTNQELPKYFEVNKTQLYVRKELKKSIFD